MVREKDGQDQPAPEHDAAGQLKLLHDLQQEQSDVLDNRGMTDKARTVLLEQHMRASNRALEKGEEPPEEPRIADGRDMTTVSVARREGHDTHGNTFEELCIKFTTADPDNPDIDAVAYVPVSQQYHSLKDIVAPVPVGEFNDDDVTVLEELMDKVVSANEQGFLPDLESDMSGISVAGTPPSTPE